MIQDIQAFVRRAIFLIVHPSVQLFDMVVQPSDRPTFRSSFDSPCLDRALFHLVGPSLRPPMRTTVRLFMHSFVRCADRSNHVLVLLISHSHVDQVAAFCIVSQTKLRLKGFLDFAPNNGFRGKRFHRIRHTVPQCVLRVKAHTLDINMASIDQAQAHHS